MIEQSKKKSIKTSPKSLSKIKGIRIGNVNKMIIGNSNIKSIRNIFEQLNETMLKYIDILVETERKLFLRFFF